MPTTNKSKECSALSILKGTMGRRTTKGALLLPEHKFENNTCRFCGLTFGKEKS